MHIKGDAIEQIKLYVDKYLKNNNIISLCTSNTRQMFSIYKEFKTKISKIFTKVNKIYFVK